MQVAGDVTKYQSYIYSDNDAENVYIYCTGGATMIYE